VHAAEVGTSFRHRASLLPSLSLGPLVPSRAHCCDKVLLFEAAGRRSPPRRRAGNVGCELGIESFAVHGNGRLADGQSPLERECLMPPTLTFGVPHGSDVSGTHNGGVESLC
jgi:hypothetical protein